MTLYNMISVIYVYIKDTADPHRFPHSKNLFWLIFLAAHYKEQNLPTQKCSLTPQKIPIQLLVVAG